MPRNAFTERTAYTQTSTGSVQTRPLSQIGTHVPSLTDDLGGSLPAVSARNQFPVIIDDSSTPVSLLVLSQTTDDYVTVAGGGGSTPQGAATTVQLTDGSGNLTAATGFTYDLVPDGQGTDIFAKIEGNEDVELSLRTASSVSANDSPVFELSRARGTPPVPELLLAGDRIAQWVARAYRGDDLAGDPEYFGVCDFEVYATANGVDGQRVACRLVITTTDQTGSKNPALEITDAQDIRVLDMKTAADDTAAASAGIPVDGLYRTAAGEVRIRVS